MVSDFSLMDAIECGIVKIPRVPIADNAMTGDYPKYRNLWVDIREGLKDVRRGPEDAHKPPLLPGLLEGALKSLYGHYARKFAEWEADEESRANGSTPPVFIVVCNNTNVSKAVFDYIAGYETEHQHPDGEPVVAAGDAAAVQQREGPALAAPAEHDPRGQPAARIRREHVRRLQEARRRTRSRTSRPSTGGGSPAATPRT